MTARSDATNAAEAVENRDRLLAAFEERVSPLGVRVERAESSVEVARFLAGLSREINAPRVTISAELVTNAPGFAAALTAEGIEWHSPEEVSEARDAPLGVSLAKLAIAETGSFLLNEPGLLDRAVGLMSKVHVALVPIGALVPSLDEAAGVLRRIAQRPGGGYASLVTGPSRTADIEMSLTVGVQGPEIEIVLFVDRLD